MLAPSRRSTACQRFVPDNTKVAVIKASLYDPQINRTYAEMAAHYGSAICRRGRASRANKAKVEQAVLMVERWLLGHLRHRYFGRAEAILAERKRIKRDTIANRRLQHQLQAA